MKPSINKKNISLIITIALTVILIAFTLFFERIFGITHESLQATIESYGALAPLVFFAVQFMQVVISPIPGNITTMVGGTIFGFGKAFAISSIAIILGAVTGFYLARKFGKPFVIKIAGKENTEKYINSLSNSKARQFLFILLMLLPFFPDDIICFTAGLTDMKWRFFLITIIITRPIGLLAASYIGANSLAYEPWMWITLVIIFIIMFLLFIIISRRLNSRNVQN